jgi:hypothetical protein
VPATVVLRTYTPGVISAVLVNVPVMSGLMVRALREEWVTPRSALRYGVGVPLALAAGIIAYLALAGRLF